MWTFRYTRNQRFKCVAVKKKIEVIDFIKGYSILSIVLFHYCQGIKLPFLLSKAINFGGTGIHTFLFASGFGLYLSHLRQPLGYARFFKETVYQGLHSLYHHRHFNGADFPADSHF